jgi:hypothetical protein
MQWRLASSTDARLLADLNRQLIEDEGHGNTMTTGELEQRMRGWLSHEYRAVISAGRAFWSACGFSEYAVMLERLPARAPTT